MPDRDPRPLLAVLEEARELGLLGPGPASRQYEHAVDLARAIGRPGGRVLDLGSGGGVPGLVLFECWPSARGVLLDAQQRRCEFLARALITLDLSERVVVRCGRAEVLARDPSLRAGFDLVVARSFGPPPVTAECAVGFLQPGGELVVTEPPTPAAGEDIPERWPPSGLAELGFAPAEVLRSGSTGAVRIRLSHVVDERWPRRDGVPAKRPLWQAAPGA
jgi:16S rRNA (guanine527-N7)-methyltransferase